MKRSLLLGTAWTASAAAAVGVGFLAVSLVDASASPGTVPAAATATGSDTAAPVSEAPVTTASGTRTTVAGIVSASCESGSLRLSGAPAAGWWLDDSQNPGEVEFETGTQKLEVHVTCVDGSPRFSVEGPRADDNGGDDRSSSPSSSSSSSASSSPSRSSSSAGPTDAPDDSDGRSGGGHGSDDPPGDDSDRDSGSDDSDDRVDDSGGDHSDDDSGKGRGRGSDD